MNMAELENNIATKDSVELAHVGDSRKPKLTFKHLHKLRKIRELKNLEKINMSKQLEMIYGRPAQEATF